MRNKGLAIGLTIMLAVGLTACGGASGGSSAAASETESAAAETAVSEAEEEAEAEAPEEAEAVEEEAEESETAEATEEEAAAGAEVNGTYDLIETVYNFGTQVSEVVIHTDTMIDGSSVSAEDFKVVTDNKCDKLSFEYENGEIEVTDAFVSEDAGATKADAGKDIVLTLKNGIEEGQPAALAFDLEPFCNFVLDLNYVVTQEGEVLNDQQEAVAIVSPSKGEIINEEVAKWTEGTSSTGMNYRDFVPETAGTEAKHPLVVWLHGGGEGASQGDQNQTPLLANRAALTFATEENQERFGDPYVLAPQCPDFWLETFEFEGYEWHGHDYSEDVVALIQEYMDAHEDIDQSKVLVVGASMGGYQTWATVAAKPDMFAAMMPCCTAQAVSDEVADACKDVPSFISHDKDDYVVSVDFSKDAYNRLVEDGADTTFVELGEIEIDGDTYDYHDGVYMLMAVNGIQNEDGVAILDWAAEKLNG